MNLLTLYFITFLPSLRRIYQRLYFFFKFFSANWFNKIIINIEELELTFHMNRLDHIGKFDIPIVEIFKRKILNALQIHNANRITRCGPCYLLSGRTHQKWSTIVCFQVLYSIFFLPAIISMM